MAVLKIKVASIIGRMTELSRVTEICGKSSAFHPDNSLSFYSDTSRFVPLNEENPYAEPLQKLKSAVEDAGKQLAAAAETKHAGQRPCFDDILNYVDDFCLNLESLRGKREEAERKAEECAHSIEEIGHFVGLELDLDEIHDCREIKVRFGSLPKESFDKLESYNENPYVIFFPCTHDTQRYWGVYFAPIDEVSEVDRIFSRLYFERIWLAELKGTPEGAVETLRAEQSAALERVKHAGDEIDMLWNREKESCRRLFTWLEEQSACFGIRRYAARYNDNFILTGWIPANREKEFRQKFDSLDTVECVFEDARDELSHSPPVCLKNRGLFRPFEFFVDMYGLPSYDEVDPTPFVAVTYILLFGIMFGDLGQGICVSIVGFLMWKLMRMPLGKILIPCGVSSALFGLFFGSVFGFEHALDPLYQSIFGLAEKPIEVMDPSKTNLIIGASIVIGVILVMVAMLLNIYSSLRRRNYENALFGPNGVAGLVFYASLILGASAQLLLGIPVLTPVYVICLILLPLLLMFFKEVLGGLVEHRADWKPESWADYCMQNFFEVFEYILSYASNTISFLRVSAFVLVHAGMMSVVFTLAGNPGVLYVVVVVLGNIIVMGLEGLLVGIQSLRLEFYEMFSRFFEGQGRPFHPVTVNH